MPRHQHCGHQQRLSRHGPPMAGTDLRSQLCVLADPFGIEGATVTNRSQVLPTVARARESGRAFLIEFQVEKEDGVYPMIAPGAALHEMIRRPDPMTETAS